MLRFVVDYDPVKRCYLVLDVAEDIREAEMSTSEPAQRYAEILNTQHNLEEHEVAHEFRTDGTKMCSVCGQTSRAEIHAPHWSNIWAPVPLQS